MNQTEVLQNITINGSVLTTDSQWVSNESSLTSEMAHIQESISANEEDEICGKSYLIVCYMFLTTVTALFGILGNGLTIVGMWSERHTSATPYLLLHLAVADILLLFTFWFIEFYHSVFDVYGVWKRWERIFAFPHSMYSLVTTFAHLAGTWIITLVTLQRYIAVSKAHIFNKWASLKVVKTMVWLVWIGCIIYSIPRIFQYRIEYDAKKDFYKRKKTDYSKSEAYSLGYKIIVYYIFVYIIPLSLIIFATYHLIKDLKLAQAKKKQLTSKSSRHEGVSLSLIIVVVIFVVCNVLNPVRRILETYALPEDSDECPGFMFYYHPITIITRMFNSAINFVIYILCSKRFRLKIIQIIKCTNAKVEPICNTQVSAMPGTNAGQSGKSGPKTVSKRLSTSDEL